MKKSNASKKNKKVYVNTRKALGDRWELLSDELDNTFNEFSEIADALCKSSVSKPVYKEDFDDTGNKRESLRESLNRFSDDLDGHLQDVLGLVEKIQDLRDEINDLAFDLKLTRSK